MGKKFGERMTEIFLFNHPPYRLLDLVRRIFNFLFLKPGAILTITSAANRVCPVRSSGGRGSSVKEFGKCCMACRPPSAPSTHECVQGRDVLLGQTCYALVSLEFTEFL